MHIHQTTAYPWPKPSATASALRSSGLGGRLPSGSPSKPPRAAQRACSGWCRSRKKKRGPTHRVGRLRPAGSRTSAWDRMGTGAACGRRLTGCGCHRLRRRRARMRPTARPAGAAPQSPILRALNPDGPRPSATPAPPPTTRCCRPAYRSGMSRPGCRPVA